LQDDAMGERQGKIEPVAPIGAGSGRRLGRLAGSGGARGLMLMPLMLAGAGASVADDARSLALGRHLSAECTSCHRIDGVDNGIPSITGWAVRNFTETMDYYRSGARTNQVMISIAKSLDAEQVAALAAYYGSLPKAKAKK
jgi:cytochrome c